MDKFKVICKIPKGYGWVIYQSKVNVKKYLFGLFSKTYIVPDDKRVGGPVKDEICIATKEYESAGEKYYNLAGYPVGGFEAKYFIKLDEFEDFIYNKKDEKIATLN